MPRTDLFYFSTTSHPLPARPVQPVAPHPVKPVFRPGQPAVHPIPIVRPMTPPFRPMQPGFHPMSRPGFPSRPPPFKPQRMHRRSASYADVHYPRSLNELD